MEQQKLLSVGQVVYTTLYNSGEGVIIKIYGEQKLKLKLLITYLALFHLEVIRNLILSISMMEK